MTDPPADGFTLSGRYELGHGRVYLTGIQALVRAVIDQGRRDQAAGRQIRGLVTGYEGSPLGGFDLELARRATLVSAAGVIHRPAVNEELAATTLVGTQLARRVATLTCDGVTGWWYGKSPGLDRATDALRHANLIGTDPTGGVVALVGDDPAAKSSTVPGCSELALADLGIPTLMPADPGQIVEFASLAVELSRISGLWAALRVTSIVADAGATVELPAPLTPVPGDAETGTGYRHAPTAHMLGSTLLELERTLVEVRLPLAREFLRRSGVNVVDGATAPGAADVLLISAGATYLSLCQALCRLGWPADRLGSSRIRLLRVGAPWPLDADLVRTAARGVRQVLVVEDKRGFLEDQVRGALYGVSSPPAVCGKADLTGRPLFKAHGELDADEVTAGVRRFLSGAGFPELAAHTPADRSTATSVRTTLPLAVRTPHFCSGCPHNTSTRAAPGTLVGAGIGCHALVLLAGGQDRGLVSGTSQMGGEGGFWLGMAPFVEESHSIQNLGDGTFAHSGSLAVRAAVAAGASMTYKLLHNGAVAMTGGQDVVGARPLGDLVDLLFAEGVSAITVTTDDPIRVRRMLGPRHPRLKVRHRDELDMATDELAAVGGVTVLIHDQQCATERRRGWKRVPQERPAARVVINERVCEGCGDCGRVSNCLSVHPVDTEFGRKTRIHQSSCNQDFSCLRGDCPSFVLVTPGRTTVRDPALTVDHPLAQPVSRFTTGVTIRITGIGGTGVVTAAQILATAAAIDGWSVRALDQLGLSQKGGPVVSDLVLGRSGLARPPRLAAGECDVYLGCDPLVAVDERFLAAADPQRTVAVMSATAIPTAAMVTDPAVTYPPLAQVADRLRPQVATAYLIDAGSAARAHLGDEQYANLVLLGFAFQAGLVPISLSAITAAVQSNGVAVERNLRAFALGRAQFDAPATPAAPPTDVLELVDRRAADLVDFHDRAYAARYLAVLDRVSRRELAVFGRIAPEGLTHAVAESLYRLMSYKDEYEVARLHLDADFVAQLRESYGAGAAYRIMLHPPALRSLGWQRKIPFGPAARALGLRPLRAMRRLRGTWADPFGGTEIRVAERQLIGEYERVVDQLLAGLTDGRLAEAVRIAALPALIRGYEQIKLDNIARYRLALDERLAAWPASTGQPIGSQPTM